MRRSCRGELIVAGATGVPQHFYRRFADCASARVFEMDYLDWATLDLAAAVDTISENGLPLFRSGIRSAGTHLACCPITSGSIAFIPSAPAPDGTAGCIPWSNCGYSPCGESWVRQSSAGRVILPGGASVSVKICRWASIGSGDAGAAFPGISSMTRRWRSLPSVSPESGRRSSPPTRSTIAGLPHVRARPL